MDKNTKTKSKRLFLIKLAKLQEEYNVAICARPIGSTGKYRQITYQFHDVRAGHSHKREELETRRCHTTAYETKLTAKEMQ